MSENPTLDLSGSNILIDGEVHSVQSGELSVERTQIRDSSGEAIKHTRTIDIEIDLWTPEDMPADAMKDNEFCAFRAGFEASAEGFNGESTPAGIDLDDWLQQMYEDWADD